MLRFWRPYCGVLADETDPAAGGSAFKRFGPVRAQNFKLIYLIVKIQKVSTSNGGTYKWLWQVV